MGPWVMYAQHRPDLGERLGREFLNVQPDERTVRYYGERHPIVAVLVTEDPEGDYWGWIYAKDDDQPPTMIQPHEGMYSMQFPYGPRAEEKAGRGWTVRLNVEEQHQ